MKLSFTRADSIFLADRDGSHQQVVLRARGSNFYYTPVWSRNGTLAVGWIYSNGHDYESIGVLRPGKKKLEEVRGPLNSFGPTWAPDSRRIAFSSYLSDTPEIETLWIDNIDRPYSPYSAERIIGDKALEGASPPNWSPDGHTIAFCRGETSPSLYLIPATGGKTRKLTEHGCDASWSPDSKRIVVADGRALYVLNVGRAGLNRLYKPRSGNASQPAWSPDGKLIAFDHTNSVWVIDADGGSVRQVIKNASEPSWNPGSY